MYVIKILKGLLLQIVCVVWMSHIFPDSNTQNTFFISLVQTQSNYFMVIFLHSPPEDKALPTQDSGEIQKI